MIVGGLTVKIVLASLSVFLTFAPTVLSAQATSTKGTLPIWRDAQPSASESELDRFNRALVDLANTARPAIVQIRVAGQEANVRAERPAKELRHPAARRRQAR